MNYSLLAMPLAVVVAFSAFADERPADKTTPSYKPRLGDIMSITQLRQYKLWYSARNQNWVLAEYELQRMKNSIQDARTFYPDLVKTDTGVIDKPMVQIDAAIKAKDGAAFMRSFGELTTACNGCHQSQGYGFIVVRVPTGSPHKNQIFTPQ